MKLRELLDAIGPAELRGDPEVGISGLAYDSGRVEPGSLFFCFKGERADGHDFAPAAVDRGAAALVVERPLELELTQAVVPDARAAMAPAAARFNREPTSELKVAGITGTNGKTTTAFLLRSILERSGIQTGLLGTVQRIVGGHASDVVRTTPEAIELQADFRAMLDAGDRACAMEVSSHALALRRTDSIRFAVAAFTNLTQDHLDFHRDMEDYFAAKRLLFEPVTGEPPRSSVVNVDDPYGARLAAEFESTTISAAGAEANFRALEIEFDESGSRFRCLGPDGEAAVSIPLPGDFNVQNALAAIATANALGVSLEQAATALAGAEPAPGRFEPVDEGQEFAVLVDYAHTPDSLENVLAAARRMTGGKLICVFGCGGDRDRDKRPLMGAIAARLADLAIVTSDNPRSEDPAAIIDEILAGAGTGPGVEVEPDRRSAIALGLATAGPGDTVVIAGKGHETGQEFEAGRKLPFDDRAVAREELRNLRRGAGV
jgi:UDP-N-acetylmuramoyl-L-alanyl-D-glutamate--2,6-diaminopimelate ligase